jgi:hypothetical protein
MPSKLSEKLQKIPFTKMIYPIITLVFTITVLFMFSKTIYFLTININKVFSDSSISLKKEITQFDQANYELIRKRFGWPEIKNLETTATSTIQITPTASATSTPTSTKQTASPTTKTESAQILAEKGAIKIMVYNGPGGTIPGESLQYALNQSGFTNLQIDSHQLILKNTIIQFKTSNPNLQKYSKEIEKIISDKYPSQIGSDLPGDTEYDVSILIGKK